MIGRLLGLAAVTTLGAGSPDMRDLHRSELCPTLGDIQETTPGRLLVTASKMRAVAPGAKRDAVEVDFKYLGPTDDTSRLASGATRRQLGLKLRAADGCNLVYVMWRLEPEPGLVVSVKRNPGARTSRECGTQGYRRLKAERSEALPAVALGSEHKLGARLTRDRLVVQADGVVVWTGLLDGDALPLEGPVGIRTDNVRLDMSFRAEPGSPAVCPGAGTSADSD